MIEDRAVYQATTETADHCWPAITRRAVHYPKIEQLQQAEPTVKMLTEGRTIKRRLIGDEPIRIAELALLIQT